MFQRGALDFAGGTVVHINAGIAGLVGSLVVGKRLGYGTVAMAPHNLPLVISVGCKNRDDNGEPTNVIKGYAKRENNGVPGVSRPTATANGSSSGVPPWKR